MDLREYFEQPAVGASKAPLQGIQTEWLAFTIFVLGGSEFLIVDASYLPSRDEGLIVKAAPGDYLVQVKVMAYGHDRRISRLRVIRQGAAAELGERLGETWTDTARTAFCDLEVFAKAWGDDNDASYARIEADLDQTNPYGVAVLDAASGAQAPFVDSGFGDGTFPVWELLESGKRVGFEVEFIPENEPYPFARGESESFLLNPPAVAPSEATDQMSEVFKGRSGSEGPSGNKASKTEQKAKLKSFFKQLEDQLFEKAQDATAEFRQHMKQVRLKAPPPRLEFLPTLDDSFLHSPEAQQRRNQIVEADFLVAGVFESTGIAQSKLASFFHSGLRTYATLIASKEGLDCELSIYYADGSSFCVTDNIRYGWLRQPPWHTVVRESVTSFQQLLQTFRSKVPERPRPPVSAEAFAMHLSQSAERHLLWNIDRGGLSKEEVRALIQLKNPAKATDQASLATLWVESVDKSLFNWLRLQSSLSFDPEGVLDSLVIIHDELTPDLLANAFWCGTRDFKVRQEDFLDGTPRAAFARVNADRGARMRLVAQKASGLKADYYLP